MIVNSQQYGDMQAGNRGSRSEKLDIFSNILIASITKNVDKTVLDPDCLQMSIKHIEVFDEDKIQASICKKNDFFNVVDFVQRLRTLDIDLGSNIGVQVKTKVRNFFR